MIQMRVEFGLMRDFPHFSPFCCVGFVPFFKVQIHAKQCPLEANTSNFSFSHVMYSRTEDPKENAVIWTQKPIPWAPPQSSVLVTQWSTSKLQVVVCCHGWWIWRSMCFVCLMNRWMQLLFLPKNTINALDCMLPSPDPWLWCSGK